jgi:hypothetical protein
VWYSSANFIHVITVSTETGGNDSTHVLDQEHCPGGDLLSHMGKLTDKQMLLVIAEVVGGTPCPSVPIASDF